MQTQTLRDGAESFDVSVLQGTDLSKVVLFAVGAGGQPSRHATLLDTLVEAGCTVIAPHFERLASPRPTESELVLRARRLTLALDAFAPGGMPVAGVGHSIGAATLIALAGGQMWLAPGQCVQIEKDDRLVRLAVLAPPTGFFRASGALDALQIPILAWAGSVDNITPPAQVEWLADAMRDRQAIEVRVTEGAGHFSFMDTPPPQTVETLPNKTEFLREHSREVCKFLIADRSAVAR